MCFRAYLAHPSLLPLFFLNCFWQYALSFAAIVPSIFMARAVATEDDLTLVGCFLAARAVQTYSLLLRVFLRQAQVTNSGIVLCWLSRE